MSKSAILKFLVCAGFVFLLLPAVFDEEKEPQTPSLAAQATDFNPSEYQGEESLPVLENAPKDNILVRYGKRFKKMYGKAFLSSNEPEESAQVKAASGEDDEDLYFAMAALLNSNTSEKRAVASSYVNDNANVDSLDVNAIAYANTPAAYVNGSSSSIKQTMHDNAPVKGLYETSSVEPYENRTKARQVYSNVMYKVDKNNPRQSVKTAVSAESASASVQTDSIEGTAAGVTSSRASNSGKYSSFGNSSSDFGSGSSSGFDSDSGEKFASAYKGFKSSSKYTGIASPSSSRSSSSMRGGSSGTYSSFRGANAGNSEDDYYGDLSSQFEVDVNKATEGIGAAKEYLDIEREKAEAEKENASQANQETRPEEGKTPSEDVSNPQPPTPPTPENPSSTPETPVPPIFNDEQPTKPIEENIWGKFNPAEHELRNLGCVNPAGEESLTSDLPDLDWKKSDPKFKVIKYEAPVEEGGDAPQICTGKPVQLEGLSPEISSNTVLVFFGEGLDSDGHKVAITPNKDAYSYKGLEQAGISNIYQGTRPVKDYSTVSGIPMSEFKNALSKGYTIITTDKKTAETYPNAIYVEGNELENREGLEGVIQKLNALTEEPKPETQAQPQVQQQSLMYYPQTEKPKPGYGVLKPTDEEIAEDKKKEITGFFGGGADFWPWKK